MDVDQPFPLQLLEHGGDHLADRPDSDRQLVLGAGDAHAWDHAARHRRPVEDRADHSLADGSEAPDVKAAMHRTHTRGELLDQRPGEDGLDHGQLPDPLLADDQNFAGLEDLHPPSQDEPVVGQQTDGVARLQVAGGHLVSLGAPEEATEAPPADNPPPPPLIPPPPPPPPPPSAPPTPPPPSPPHH